MLLHHFQLILYIWLCLKMHYATHFKYHRAGFFRCRKLLISWNFGEHKFADDLFREIKIPPKFIAREISLLHAVSVEQRVEDEVQERIAREDTTSTTKNGQQQLGEILCCACEVGNVLDCYAVCVLKDGNIVGHLPRKISKVYSLFLWRVSTLTLLSIATSARESST